MHQRLLVAVFALVTIGCGSPSPSTDGGATGGGTGGSVGGGSGGSVGGGSGGSVGGGTGGSVGGGSGGSVGGGSGGSAGGGAGGGTGGGVDAGSPDAGAPDAGPVDGGNYLFVTHAMFTVAELGGLAGADRICQVVANDAGIPGVFRAWLSAKDAGLDAPTRLGTTHGWKRVDGLPVAIDLASLEAGKLLYAPGLDEHGGLPAGTQVWTGTMDDGTVQGGTCSSWTDGTSASTTYQGSTVMTTFNWTIASATNCTVSGALYCLGTNVTSNPPFTRATGRTAFVTEATFAPTDGGIAVADALCAREATAASLSGTFLAFLAPTGGSASSRFNVGSSSLPWVRTDGVLLARTAAEAMDGTTLLASLNVTAKGAYVRPLVWTGAQTPTAPDAGAANCGNWADTGATGYFGGANGIRDQYWIGYNTLPCSNGSVHLYCLQQ